MARKRIKVSKRMLFTWFLLAGFIFLLAPQSLTNKFQFAFTRVFRWPLSIGRNISLSARIQQPLTDVVSRREFDKLQNHLANVTEELLEKHKQIERISGLRDRLHALEGAKLRLADVITASIDGSRCELIINRGEDDELAEGQFVLGDNSIVGTVSDVSPRTAKVKLITDLTSKIAVKIRELKTIIQGSGQNSVKVQLLSIKHKVEVGDEVYARKKPGFLDAPVKVGTVARCKRDDENPLLWDITVKPACDVEKLKDVAVIIMNPQE
ncbi:MAG: rod shape-determining protein MreC [Planctomycetota bacterium]|nr:MAG: rod shape-determining protein MreC [Planctomycetota bacterium]